MQFHSIDDNYKSFLHKNHFRISRNIMKINIYITIYPTALENNRLLAIIHEYHKLKLCKFKNVNNIFINWR